jgi:hypothetical protein
MQITLLRQQTQTLVLEVAVVLVRVRDATLLAETVALEDLV